MSRDKQGEGKIASTFGKMVLLFGVSASALAAGPAFAQTAVGAATSEDIVVTARGRTEQLQEVPLAISVVNEQTIQRAGVMKLSDAAALTAGLLLPKSSSERQGSGVMRGVVDLSGTGTPTVSTFFNGVYLGNPTAVSIGMMDTQRIEIVKGPVGTQYGRGAFAGAINYVLREPGDKLAARITAEVGNGNKQAVYGYISGPVIPGVLSLGLSGNYDDFDGTYKDAVNGLPTGGHEKKDTRVSFKFTPVDSLYLSGGFYHGDDYFMDEPAVHATNNCGTTTNNALTAALPDSVRSYYCGKYITTRPLEVANLSGTAKRAGNSREVDLGDLHAGADFGWADLTLTGGYSKIDQVTFQDFTTYRDGIPFTLTPGPGTANLAELFGSNNNTIDRSVELRLASKQDQPLRWAVGGYFSKQHGSTSTLIGLDASRLPPGQTVASPFLTSNGQFSTSNLTYVETTDEQSSVFAALEYDVIPDLTLNAEVRSTNQDKFQDIIRNAFIANTVRPYGAAGTTSASFDYTSYRIGARYKITPNTMIYVSQATSQKPGGFNTRASIPSEISYEPEENLTVEAGVKSTFFDDKVLLNLAAFTVKDSGLQVSGPSANPANTGLVTKNFGTTRSDGFEVETQAKLTKMVTVSGALAYSDPRFQEGSFDFSPATCVSVGTFCPATPVKIATASNPNPATNNAVSLAGLQVRDTSKVLANFGLDLHGDFGDDAEWFARADYRYESKRFVNSVDDILWVPDRSNINLSTGITKGHVGAVVYVNNVTNDATPINALANVRLSDFGNTFVGTLPDARLYGLRLSYTY